MIGYYAIHILSIYMVQASTLTQNETGPGGPVTPSIYWSCRNFTGPTFFFKHNKKEHWIKFTTTFIFINFNFISKTFGDILGGKLFNKNVSKCLLGLLDQLKSIFTGPKLFLGIFTGLGP